MNLLMAAIWLVVGFAMLGHELNSGKPGPRIWNTGIPVYWLAFGLAAFNLTRWYSQRSLRHARDLEPLRPARWRARRERPSEPDPTFDFTSDPPPPPRPTVDPPPPSPNGGAKA